MQSNFLCWSGGGGADFSPNGEVMDPHLDVRPSPNQSCLYHVLSTDGSIQNLRCGVVVMLI